MRVTLDVAGGTDDLGGSEVVLFSVDEEARVEVGDGHGDGEVLVRGDRVQVLGECELGGRHVGRRGDHTHGGGVTRTSSDLLTVGDGQVGDSETEVNEVVARGG